MWIGVAMGESGFFEGFANQCRFRDGYGAKFSAFYCPTEEGRRGSEVGDAIFLRRVALKRSMAVSDGAVTSKSSTGAAMTIRPEGRSL